MKIYLATNETPPAWMFKPNDDYVNSKEESVKRIQELDALNAVPFAWIEETKRFQPLKSFEKGKKPKIQDFDVIIKWEL
jgi:hypothetical protein